MDSTRTGAEAFGSLVMCSDCGPLTLFQASGLRGPPFTPGQFTWDSRTAFCLSQGSRCQQHPLPQSTGAHIAHPQCTVGPSPRERRQRAFWPTSQEDRQVARRALPFHPQPKMPGSSVQCLSDQLSNPAPLLFLRSPGQMTATQPDSSFLWPRHTGGIHKHMNI